MQGKNKKETSKLVEAAAEFLSRGTSQSKTFIVEEVLHSDPGKPHANSKNGATKITYDNWGDKQVSKVLHNKGGDHLTSTHNEEEGYHPVHVSFHGHVKGHKVAFTASNPEGDNEPTHEHIKAALHAAHPNMPENVKHEVLKHAKSPDVERRQNGEWHDPD